MAYSLKKLTEELKEKGLADDGLVAWGQSSNGMFGAVGAAVSGMYTISCQNGNLLVTPFSNKQIFYDRSVAYRREVIKKAKFSSGIWTGKLKFETVDGKTFVYPVTQGKGAVKQILAKLGL